MWHGKWEQTIVIGVDVQDPMKNAEELQNNIFAQLNQLIDLQRKDRWEQNIALSDVYIKVDVKGYNTASFNTTAIDSLMERGAQAARSQIDTLRAIGGRFSPDDSIVSRPTPPSSICTAREISKRAMQEA